jgi:hypothetical protein
MELDKEIENLEMRMLTSEKLDKKIEKEVRKCHS